MEKSIISEGKTTNEAIEKGLEQLKVSKNMVDIKDDGWYEYSSATGSHHSFKHNTKKGRVVVPHPKKDLPIGTVKNIAKQAQIKLK